MPNFYKKSYITILLVILNVAVFLLGFLFEQTFGAFSLEHELALYTPAILQQHQYYRLLTSMFMHLSMEHLGANMLALFAVGPYIEKIFGKAGFTAIYFFSGLCGSVLTMAVESFTGDYSFCVGASGAIFGLFGAIAFLALLPQYRRIFPMKNVLISLIVSLAPGFTDSQISLTGHIGGLIGGFLMAAFLYRCFVLLKGK